MSSSVESATIIPTLGLSLFWEMGKDATRASSFFVLRPATAQRRVGGALIDRYSATSFPVKPVAPKMIKS